MTNVKYIAYASRNVQELTGKGTEYLLDSNGDIIAVFIDGYMNGSQPAIEKNSKTIGEAITFPNVLPFPAAA